MSGQPDGAYPRLNAELFNKGRYTDMIVSFVGKFGQNSTSPDGKPMVDFTCCDGGVVPVSVEQANNLPDGFQEKPEMVYEIIGQVTEEKNTRTVVVFVARELTEDMDLDLHNKMIQVQHNPKFREYFGLTYLPNSMATN